MPASNAANGSTSTSKQPPNPHAVVASFFSPRRKSAVAVAFAVGRSSPTSLKRSGAHSCRGLIATCVRPSPVSCCRCLCLSCLSSQRDLLRVFAFPYIPTRSKHRLGKCCQAPAGASPRASASPRKMSTVSLTVSMVFFAACTSSLPIAACSYLWAGLLPGLGFRRDAKTRQRRLSESSFFAQSGWW